MAVRGNLSLKGLEKYLETLAEAGKDVDAAADRANVAGGDVALAGTERRVPKDTHNLEQHLSRSAPQADGNFHYVTVGLDPDTDADTARYGNAQEFGTSEMAAQPYIRPTFDEDKAKIRKAQRQSLEQDGKL
jgi:HK97 gp10 family phage protein